LHSSYYNKIIKPKTAQKTAREYTDIKLIKENIYKKHLCGENLIKEVR